MNMEHKKSNILNKLLASDDQPVHKMMMAHLLLSVSIFSFLFSYYSLWSSSPLYSRKFNYFSANSFQLPSHALMNKNYIFLICNGLLVFLTKTSGLVLTSSSGSFDLINDMLQKKIGDGLLTYYNISLETKEPATLNKEVFETKEVEKRVIEEEGSEILNEEPPKEVSIFIAESDEEQGAAAAGSCEHIEEEEEEKAVVFPPAADQGDKEKEGEEEEEDDDDDDDDHAELLSTEELNQKFEEFIRKMKEEIMINEALDRQLAIVK